MARSTRAHTREAPDDEPAEEWHGDVIRSSPTTIDCDDYAGHQTTGHRFFTGIGWRCVLCEQRRAADGPSFTDRVEAARDHAF